MDKINKKKILHISKYYYPFRGGTEQMAQDCVNVFRDGYEQKVICFHNSNKNIVTQIDGIEVIRCGCFAKVRSQSLSLSYGKILRKCFQEFQPDIIIFHYPNPFVAQYLLKYCGKKETVIVYWHLDIIKQKILKYLFHNQNMKLINRADKIIATSSPYIENSDFLNLVQDKCCVVPNCVDVEKMKSTQDVQELSEKIRVDNQNKIICLAVGRHIAYKGIRYLVQASKLLSDKFVIYLIGNGELTKSLKKEVDNDSKVIFLGQATDLELKAYLQACDIFCFPSITRNEAFGVALAEAMFYPRFSET